MCYDFMADHATAARRGVSFRVGLREPVWVTRRARREGRSGMESLVGREMLSRRVRAVKPSGIRKFFDIAATMSDVISLGVGEPDFVTPEHIRHAGIAAIQLGEPHYPSTYGPPVLRHAITDLTPHRYALTAVASTAARMPASRRCVA